MKKLTPLLYTPLIAASVLLPCAQTHADTILGIYAGAGTWNASLDGSIGVDDIPITTDELGLEADNSTFVYVALEHPIPLIPNVRIHHSTLKSEGYAVVERNFTWSDVTFPAEAATTTLLDFTQTDITLYYEILDNWVSLDVGVTAKVLDGTASVYAEPEGLAVVTEEIELTGAIPMVYGMARFDLPLSGAYIAGNANYVSYDNSVISDLDIRVGWAFESVLDIGAELGFRQFKMELVDFDDANTDLTFDGPYLNVAIHF
ncbi:TIGR04219 family outer membrane beta-barrel protein [Teredinibacter haidensis]|uniref:TIGR04219 family outer membrane beta-barrel protein n=1 Tax=Teredinibacter haidensis TaxID=2731755 RepID=UPI0009488E2C|nr:TIGR04219 family outer membrane beta-barrel protein [Teredinibacter haidensis]